MDKRRSSAQKRTPELEFYMLYNGEAGMPDDMIVLNLVEMAEKMLGEGFDVNTVSRISGLTVDAVLRLKSSTQSPPGMYIT